MNARSKAALGALLAPVLWAGCSSQPVRLATGPEIPAAQGTVKAETTDNRNTRLDLTVRHLAPPEKIAASATTYVVWAQPVSGGQPSNLGALQINADREGRISTTTPLHDFKLFVTAEPSGQAQAPSGEQLLWTDISSG